MLRWLLLLFVLAVLLTGAAAGGAWYWYTRDAILTKPKVLVVEGGTRQVAELLTKEGIIRHPLPFIALNRLTKRYLAFRAGEYEFPAGVTPQQAEQILISGAMVQRQITLKEGTTTADFLPLLNEATGLKGEAIKSAPEGSLLAETYFYTWGETRQALLDRMQAALKKELATLWKARAADLPVKTPAEAVVLASIIEKETGLPGEHGKVGSVYTNRLRIGMLLQADPTVIYAHTGGKGKMDAPLLYKDLEIDNPYNTYRYKGLPPTPIANVGKAALKAALQPEKTPYLYFVADGTGGHVFGRTLAEHNRNVANWRKVQRAAREKADKTSKP